MKLKFVGTLGFLAAAFFLNPNVQAQKASAKRATVPRPIIFAVVDGSVDSKWIEPIAVVDRGKLEEPMSESYEGKAFGRDYHKPRSTYPLIFGGGRDGLVTVLRSNIGTECGGSSAEVKIQATKAKIAMPIFALATNVKLKPDEKSFRRRPNPAERAEIEKLVRANFSKNGASAAAAKTLHYHNLTAMDVDGNGIPEFVGSYWIAPTSHERRLLFFIAERSEAALEMTYSEHSVVKPDDIMSGDLKDLEGGRGAELLLDELDYDNDGVGEIFTIGQAFEGNNYYAYKRANGKWTRVFETYMYRCAY